MKSTGIKSGTCINFCLELHIKKPNFQVGDHLWISMYKKVFSGSYKPNWIEQVSAVIKVKDILP